MKKILIITGTMWIILSAAISAEPIDISDAAIGRFLSRPFQFDYTTLTNDTTLRQLIDALDYQLAVIEYRQIRERMATPDDTDVRQRFATPLQERYATFMRDGFLFKKLEEGRRTTKDNIIRQCIRQLFLRRGQLMTDPNMLERIQTLAGRIADRLYKFHFEVDGKVYSAVEANTIIESGSDPVLANRLFKLQNDSAGVLANDATRLYMLYNQMGEQYGYPTSFDYAVSQLSFSREAWNTIAEELKKITDAEYNACLERLKRESGKDRLTLYEIELMLRRGTALPDNYFPIDKADAAVKDILIEFGLESIYDELGIVTVDSAAWPAVSLRLNPPYKTRLIKSSVGDFAYYRRLVAEIGRTLPWVYADSTLPNMLRNYPGGTEEMLTTLFENRALDKTFMAEHFDLPPDKLDRFITYNRWINIFRLRQILLNFFFDSYLSEGKSADPISLYWSLEKSILNIDDSTYYWIETLISGNLNKYPKWMAYNFSRVKIAEILNRKFNLGQTTGTVGKPEDIAAFLIDRFCRPGKSQSLQEFIARNTDDPLSIADIRRQMKLK